jgi:hypothetical protein
MTEIDAAWLAGFLDGEGSFMVTRYLSKGCIAPTYDAVISAGNTDVRLVEKCRDLAGGKIAATTAKNPMHRNAYVWQLKGPHVAEVATAVLPFLVSKRAQALVVLELRSITRLGSPKGRNSTRKTPEEVAARATLYERCKALNTRGSANPEYAQLARDRISGDSPLFAEVA